MGAEISVVITTYKRKPEMVRRAVMSVLGQSFEDLELLVVDDNAPGDRAEWGVEDMLRALGDSRIRYLPMEKNSGACAARNAGSRAAGGRYICFLDDDDEYLPDKLSLQRAALEGAPQACMAVGDFYVRSGGRDRKVVLDYDEKDMLRRIFFKSRLATPNPLIRRECLEEAGYFDEALPSAQDADLWARMLERRPGCIVRDFVYIQNIHPGERITGNQKKKLEGNILFVKKHEDFLKKHPRLYSRIVLYQAKRHILLKDKKQWESFRQAVAIFPPGIFAGLARMLYWQLRG